MEKMMRMDGKENEGERRVVVVAIVVGLMMKSGAGTTKEQHWKKNHETVNGCPRSLWRRQIRP